VNAKRKALPLPRWHQDSDQWIWRVYDANNVNGPGEETTNIYIIPFTKGWCLIDATDVMEGDWIARVMAGEAKCVAGPFANANGAKAAWRLIYG
jgi:hypothetical protein